MDHQMLARFDEDKTARSFVVRAPAVGLLDRVPDVGMYQNPMASFGVLTVLGRQHTLLLPRNVGGRVVEQLVKGMHVPVEYNQPLFRLKVGSDDGDRADATASAGAQAQQSSDLIAVPSPSDGIFYRRAGPDSPPYVDVGSAVTTGTVLGLVEVMKCFNQIVYGGPGFPERGTVVQVHAGDAAEVKFGSPLFHVKPEE